MNNKNLIYLGLAALALFLLNKKKEETSASTDGTTDQTFPGNPEKPAAPSNTGVVPPINN
jgi:hypothetical protein